MQKSKIALLFISLFLIRWYFLARPLPQDWTTESVVSVTITILEKPEITDTKTIVRNGIWYIPVKGYPAIIPGMRVRFTGTVEPKIELSKVTRVVMKDPGFVILPGERTSPLQKIIILIGNVRERWLKILQQVLPEPMASLAAGILLGVKAAMPEDFYQALVSTGTLHIIAASGYNVSIILTVMMRLALAWLSRGKAIVCGIVVLIAYIVMAGAGASVVRAGIIGSLTLIAYYFGRPADAKRLLWITAALMLLIKPLLILDIGFQLSFCATAGLFYLEPIISFWANKCVCRFNTQIQAYLAEYLYPTLAATISTLPIILWHFGRVSWISPLVNMLVLPIVPLIMGLTAGVIGVGVVMPGLAQVLAWFLYPLLWYMVSVIRLFG